jgi:DUF2971 family protein
MTRKETRLEDLIHFDQINSKGVPPLLYKFRSWDDNYHKEVLLSRKLWFASPRNLNDPSDCKLPFGIDFTSDKNAEYELKKELTLRYPKWDVKKISYEVLEILKQDEKSTRHPNFLNEATRNNFRFFETKYGILSFACSLNINQLWDKYSNNHRGFCVEFDGHILADELIRYYYDDKSTFDFLQVEYFEEMPKIIYTKDNDVNINNFIKILKSKYISWKYEDEFRFVSIGKAGISYQISEDPFKKIFLGCDMESEHQKEIIDVVSTNLPNTEILKAEKSLDKFKLNFLKIK